MSDPIIDALIATGTNIISSIIYDLGKGIKSPKKARFFPNSLLLSRESIRTLDRRIEKFLEKKRWEYSTHPVLYAYFKADSASDVERLKPFVCAALFSEPYSIETCAHVLETLRVNELDTANSRSKNIRNAVRPDIEKYSLENLDVEGFNKANIRDLRKSLFEKDEVSQFLVSRVTASLQAFADIQTPKSRKGPADEYLLEYCEEIRTRTSSLMTSGIDAFLRQEQLDSQLEASFVSLSLRELWDNTKENVSENAEQVFREFKYIIARGDAGSGKTTLLQWISLQCARSVLGHPPSLAATASWNKTIPVLVPLRRIVTNYSGRINVSDFVMLSTDSVDLSRKVGPNWMDVILNNRDVLIMFDGLDELRAGSGNLHRTLSGVSA
jgi:hypothetical protein